MKKTELKQIIKEEILKEIDLSLKKRMDGLVNRKHLSKIQDAILDIYKDFRDEGFLDDEVKEYILTKINIYLK